MLSYHCYHFKYIELNMISLKSVVERLLLNMWQTSSGIKKDNFDFLSKFDVLKRWSPSSLFTTPNGKRGVTRTCFKCLENIILRMKHVLPTALLIWLQLSLLSYQPFGCSNEKLFNNFSVLGHTKWIPCFASFQFWKVVRACGFEFYLLFFSV